MFLSSPVASELLFQERSSRKGQARAIFFACSSESSSWLNELDVQSPSILFRQPSVMAERREITGEWYRRLGIEPFNKTKDSIRIAP